MIRLLSRFSGAREERIRAAWSCFADEFSDLWACQQLLLFFYGFALCLVVILAIGSAGH